MLYDNLVTQNVVASVEVSPAVADRTRDFLKGFASRKADYRFSIGKREFRTPADGAGSIDALDDGGCVGQVVMEVIDDASDLIRLGVKLARKASDKSGRLTLTFNPSRMLAGADVAPTLSWRSKEAPECPSSSHEVNAKLLRLGFDLLDRLYAEENANRPLFGKGEELDDGEIRLERVQWDLLVRTPDPAQFLLFLVLIFKAVFKGDGGGAVNLGELLRLKTTYDSEPHTGAIRSVTLTRIQGVRRKVFSITFSRVVSDGSTNEEEEATDGRLRLSVTAHPDGIAQLIRAAQREYDESGDRDESDSGFLYEEPDDRTLWSLRWVIHVLGTGTVDDDHRTPSGSFADWLAIESLRETLCLDVIGCFTHENLKSLVGLDDVVVEAWAQGQTSPMDIKALAEAAGVSAETVRTRTKELRRKYRIDMRAPRAFYDAMVTLAAIGAMDMEAREALAAALSNHETNKTLELLLKAVKEFEHGRLRVIGAAVNGALNGRLGQFPVEEVQTEVEVLTRKSHQSRKPAKPKRKRQQVEPALSAGRKRGGSITRSNAGTGSKQQARRTQPARTTGVGSLTNKRMV